MQSNRAFSLVEMMVSVVILVVLCSLLVMTFSGLQKTISASKRGMDLVSESELILQVIQTDLQSLVHPTLSLPVQLKVDRDYLDLFLCQIKGYQSMRRVSLIGYSLAQRKKKLVLLRYVRSMEWDDSFYGVTDNEEENALNSSVIPISPSLLNKQEEEVSSQVVDFTFFYHFEDRKSHVRWITSKPFKKGATLRAITVALVVSNLSSFTDEVGYQIDPLPSEEIFECGRNPVTEVFPWIKRFDKFKSNRLMDSDPRVKTEFFYRTMEVM